MNNNNNNFLQSEFWAEFKCQFGYKQYFFDIPISGLGNVSLRLLVRPLAPGIYFAYCPWGPEIEENEIPDDTKIEKCITELALKLKKQLPKNIAFIRFDFPWFSEGDVFPPPLKPPFFHAASDTQPPDTVLLDITKSEGEILQDAHSKCRYNIRLGTKKVSIADEGDAGIDVFYKLFLETAARDGIAAHSLQYYKKLYEIAGRYAKSGEKIKLSVYVARYNALPVAAVCVLFYNDSATYLYGASANVHRNLMAPHALQWRAILDAKKFGCLQYDLFGIPPTNDPNHSMHGLYQFKTAFGGRIIHRPGSWDFPFNKLFYSVFHAAEKLRKNLRAMRKKSRAFTGPRTPK
jgi:lipid II:glycine glycyltransferase (peptidoglycan interpeptide bridge formation enzyme)